MDVSQSNCRLARSSFGSDCASSTPILHVTIASPESVLLTFSIDDVFEASINEHGATSLSFGELKPLVLENCS